MRQLSLSITIIIVIISLVNCGTIKVESDTISDAVDKIIDAASGSGDSGETSETSETSTDSTDTSNSSHVFETDSTSVERYFIGTFTERYVYQNCQNWPTVIRLYSYSNRVDIEDNTQNRIASAVQYPDDTFDFTATYLDALGNPDIDLNCTCSITVDPYYADELDCDCDSGSMNSCHLFYEKIE